MVVHHGANDGSRIAMARPARKKDEKQGAHRLSVSLTPEQHTELVDIANKNKVSVAWVVREAIERLLHDEQPLFHVRQPK